MTSWIEDGALENWQTCGPDGQARYADAAIQTSLMLRTAFKLPLRQTEGLMASVLALMNQAITAPDHTTVSRHAMALPVIQPASASVPNGPLHVLYILDIAAPPDIQHVGNRPVRRSPFHKVQNSRHPQIPRQQPIEDYIACAPIPSHSGHSE
jgi:hypothetical protein